MDAHDAWGILQNRLEGEDDLTDEECEAMDVLGAAMVATTPPQDRATRLEAFAGDQRHLRADSLTNAGVDLDRAEAIVPFRYVASTWGDDESYLEFANTIEEMQHTLAQLGGGESAWAPGEVLDLDTGARWLTSVAVTLEPTVSPS